MLVPIKKSNPSHFHQEKAEKKTQISALVVVAAGLVEGIEVAINGWQMVATSQRS